jgi:DNA-binding MarR family transcriptional regulator
MSTDRQEPKYYICSLATAAARKLVAYYNRELAGMGLTAQQVMALGVLHREDGISLGEFAARSGIGKASAVAMITRLESMGLVSRRPHPQDGRLNVISLTEQARALTPEVMEKVQRLEDALERALGEDELRAVIHGLSIIGELDV